MEITDNGHYYIGLTNSEFVLYTGMAYTSLTAVIITTNAPAGTLTKTEAVSVNPANSMTIFSGKIIPDVTVKEMNVKIKLLSPFVTGNLEITVSSLVRIVRVERKLIIPYQKPS